MRAFAAQRLVLNLATACGMMTAGLVAATSFFWLFVVDTATAVIPGLVILFGLKRGIGRKYVTASSFTLRKLFPEMNSVDSKLS